MITIKIALVDEHIDFIRKIAANLENQYGDKVEAHIFDSLDLALNDIRDTGTYDLLLVDEALASGDLTVGRGVTLAYLMDNAEVESLYDKPTICKYQRLDLLYQAIVELCSSGMEHMQMKTSTEINSKVISFFPAAGGVGASTLAAACAVSAAKRELSVCYLNFELYGSSERYFTAPGNRGMEDALLAIKTKKSNLPFRFQSMIKKVDVGLYFMESCSNPVDKAEIRPDEFERLVSAVSQADSFDLIVCDLDFAWSPLASTAMNLSDMSVFVSNGTAVANEKLSQAYSVMRTGILQDSPVSAAGMAIMYNDVTGAGKARIPSPMVPVLGEAPHVNAATAWQLLDELSSHRCFNGIFVEAR